MTSCAEERLIGFRKKIATLEKQSNKQSKTRNNANSRGFITTALEPKTRKTHASDAASEAKTYPSGFHMSPENCCLVDPASYHAWTVAEQTNLSCRLYEPPIGVSIDTRHGDRSPLDAGR